MDKAPTIRSETTVQPGPALRLLLFCGILSPLCYIAADIIAAVHWRAYSYASQNISELMALGAPTRPFLIKLFSVHNVLTIAFGLGVLALARKRSLRIAGILLAAFALAGFAGLFLAPMHVRETAQKSATDSWHIIVTALIVLLTIGYVAFGSGARGKGFRLYSVLTIVTSIVFGTITALQGPRMAAHLPTPLMGLTERVGVYAPMIWILVLAAVLLRGRSRPGEPSPDTTPVIVRVGRLQG